MYSDYYGFSEKPFNVTPDPKFLFETAGHREALASMLYGITERRGFVVVTGEVGTGKTTLIYALLNKIEDQVKTVFIFHTNITFLELLKTILHELNIPAPDESKAGLLRTLNDYLIEKLARDEIIAIIIDEAQNLSREAMEDLRMLSNLETHTSKLLQIVLVGQPELEKRLQSEDLRQLRQRIWIKCRVQPLTEDESRKYIEHRLKLVGGNPAMFSADAIALICAYAGGIPRSINAVCDNALLYGYSMSSRKIDAAIVKEVIHDFEYQVLEAVPQQEQLPRMLARPAYNTAAKLYSRVALGLLIAACIALCVLLVMKSPDQWSAEADKISYPQPASAISIPVVAGKNLLEAKAAPAAPTPVPAAPAQIVKPDTPAPAQTIAPVPAPAVLDKTAEKAMIAAPSDSAAAEPLAANKVVTVQLANSLFNLAKSHYRKSNATIVELILKANPDITDINFIRMNQRVTLPDITPDALIVAGPDNSFTILLGTFETPDAANRYWKEPLLKDREIKVIPRRVSSSETWYRVEAGNFNSRQDCLQVINQLQQKNLLPALLSLRVGELRS